MSASQVGNVVNDKTSFHDFMLPIFVSGAFVLVLGAASVHTGVAALLAQNTCGLKAARISHARAARVHCQALAEKELEAIVTT